VPHDQKGVSQGVEVCNLDATTDPVCNACLQAKMTLTPFQVGHVWASKQLEHIHSNLCGEFEHPTLGGNCYFATLINDMTGMMWVCPLKWKANFIDWFIKMDAMFNNQHGKHIGILCTDNGGEYVNQ